MASLQHLRKWLPAAIVVGVGAIVVVGCAQGGTGGDLSAGDDASALPSGGDADVDAGGSDAHVVPKDAQVVDTGAPLCKTDNDCAASSIGKYCDTATGACVECLPSNDKCPVGQFCDPSEKCQTGCRTNADCQAAGGDAGSDGGVVLVCATATHQCVGCVADTDCPLGSLCNTQTGTCTLGCTPAHGCVAGKTCCPASGGKCVDTKTDAANCGACGAACDTTNSTGTQCASSACKYTGCKAGFGDCDQDPGNLNGCETPLNTITNCAACGIKCDTTSSVGAACNGTSCTYTGCKPGFGDCDGDAYNANGCEASLNSAQHCGACGNVCDTIHSVSPACASGTCTYASCQSGYDDCDKNPPNTNGCETHVNTRQQCGACGTVCGNGADCCNLTCTPTNTNQNCGTCGNTCTSAQTCQTNTCVTFGTCTAPVVITGNGAYSGNTSGRPTSGSGASCQANTGPGDIVFALTATRTSTITASMCTGTSWDTVLYAGSTCGASNVGCSDDSCVLQSSLAINATQGTTYYIVLTGYNGSGGAYTLTISGM